MRPDGRRPCSGALSPPVKSQAALAGALATLKTRSPDEFAPVAHGVVIAD